MNATSPRLLIIMLLLATAAVAGAADPQAQDFSLPGTDAATISLQACHGKPVYLDFWASWCGPCRQSFPWMNTLHQRFGADGLVIIAINLDKDRKLADQFIAETRPQFIIAYDPAGRVAEDYSVQVMPSSFLIDRDGRLVSRHLGFTTGKTAQIETEIAQLLQRH